ncbi:unnamed protein product [Withania somnifera]
MAKFIGDAKNKIQDLFVYLVSCGKSSKDQLGPIEVTNVPTRVVNLQVPSPGYLQREGLFVPEPEDAQEIGQGNAKGGGIHDTIVETSRGPGKRAPPRPKTG